MSAILIRPLDEHRPFRFIVEENGQWKQYQLRSHDGKILATRGPWQVTTGAYVFTINKELFAVRLKEQVLQGIDKPWRSLGEAQKHLALAESGQWDLIEGYDFGYHVKWFYGHECKFDTKTGTFKLVEKVWLYPFASNQD
ncbi:hypothetical protein [Pontiella sp.]|uniref:hypothetical protein n=1 Tax=Pontiella sp. TaxID=2837462 RepID=UPI0035653709